MRRIQRIVHPRAMHFGFRRAAWPAEMMPQLPISRTVADAAISATESRDGCFSAGGQFHQKAMKRMTRLVQLLHAVMEWGIELPAPIYLPQNDSVIVGDD